LHLVRTLTLALLLALVPACDRTDDEIRGTVTLLVSHEGSSALQSIERLSRYGRRALPTIEGAMHTASPAGKKNLIAALRKIADVESVPLLEHIALHDPAADVRREAEWTLKQWAAGSGTLADQARRAVRGLEEKRGSEEAG
jgi:hypothetical protein